VTRTLPAAALAALAATALLPASPAAARSSIRVGLADQSPRMFDAPQFQKLAIKRTRYFMASDVMQDAGELAKATAFVDAARAHGASTLLHISTADLRSKKGKLVSTTTYRRNAGRIVAYFRKLGVRDFGAWDEENHASQETWNHIGNAVSYFKSMYTAVKSRCRSCTVVGLDVLDQAGADRYMRSFYARLSSTWRRRLGVVGIQSHPRHDVTEPVDVGVRVVLGSLRADEERVVGRVLVGAYRHRDRRQAAEVGREESTTPEDAPRVVESAGGDAAAEARVERDANGRPQVHHLDEPW